MKEFSEVMKTVIDNQRSVAQLKQLCMDTQKEIKKGKNSILEATVFFNTMYNLNWNYEKLVSLGKFIEEGKFLDPLNEYIIYQNKLKPAPVSTKERTLFTKELLIDTYKRSQGCYVTMARMLGAKPSYISKKMSRRGLTAAFPPVTE